MTQALQQTLKIFEYYSCIKCVLVTYFFVCFLGQMYCQNSFLSCPPFDNGTQAVMNLTVDNTTFPKCQRPPETITCNFQPPASAEVLVCPVDVTKCDTTKASQGCTCIQELSTGYIYTLNFTLVTETHQGGNYSCNMDCLAGQGKAPVVVISDSCLNVDVIGEDPPPAPEDQPEESAGGVLAAAMGAVAVVAGCFMAIVVSMHRKKKNRKNKKKKPEQEVPQPDAPAVPGRIPDAAAEGANESASPAEPDEDQYSSEPSSRDQDRSLLESSEPEPESMSVSDSGVIYSSAEESNVDLARY